MRDPLTPATVGDEGRDVAFVQRRLHVYPADGVFRDDLATRVRGVQLALGRDVTGDIDNDLFAILGWEDDGGSH